MIWITPLVITLRDRCYSVMTDPDNILSLTTTDIYAMKNIRMIDDETLASFRWPSCREADNTYAVSRYLADFILKDSDGSVIDDMLMSRRKVSESYTAEGTLLARPGSAVASICNIKIPFSSYCIDFSEIGNSNRGYWLESTVKGEKFFYKLVRPHPEYSRSAEIMEVRIEKFLEFYDFIAANEHLNQSSYIELPVTIHDLYNRSDSAFDCEFLCQNSAFILLNLGNSIDANKSVIFIESMRVAGNLDTNDVITFFSGMTLKFYLKAQADIEKKKAQEIKRRTESREIKEGRDSTGSKETTSAGTKKRIEGIVTSELDGILKKGGDTAYMYYFMFRNTHNMGNTSIFFFAFRTSFYIIIIIFIIVFIFFFFFVDKETSEKRTRFADISNTIEKNRYDKYFENK